MKVAMFGPFSKNLNNGVSNHVHYLSKELGGQGVEVERISWKDSGDRIVSLQKIPEAIKECKADVIHLHSTAIIAMNFVDTRIFGKNAVSTIHSFFHEEYEYSLRMKLISRVFGNPYIDALRKIRKNVTISSFMKEEAEKNKVRVSTVIGNGIPFEEFRKAKFDDGLESDVLFVGRFTEQKGIFDFIEAFGGSGVNALVIGHGDPKTEKKVVSECAKKGIQCMVNLPREKLLSAYKSCKVYAFPSHYEPFGISGLEALACGKPVVVYEEAGGPLDYVENGKNGLIIENSPASLREWCSSLVKNEKLLKEMEKNALKTAEKYDWGRVASRYMEVYSSALLK